MPSNFAPPISDAAMIAWVCIEKVRALWESREKMMEAYSEIDSVSRERVIGFSREDAFHPGTIAQNETDYCLACAVQSLGRLRVASSTLIEKVSARLSEEFQGLPLRRFTAM
jgi:hypothetical protein